MVRKQPSSVNEKVVNKPSYKVTFPAKLELIVPMKT